jgi:hypothetical protein
MEFITLSRGCEIRPREGDEFMVVLKMHETICCTEGGSIKFVCEDHLGKAMVKMWTLDLACRKWKAGSGVLSNENVRIYIYI